MYLLDTNVFIRAKNEYYGLDVAPGFWDWIAEEYQTNDLRSISAVHDELVAKKDDLSIWVSRLPTDFWLEETDEDVASLRSVAQWTMTTPAKYTQQARTDFLAKADYRLVAAAAAGKHVVISHEVSAPDSQRAIKIPDACAAFQVVSREPFELFRDLGLQLVRPPKGAAA
jgi:hypothetical protein